LQQQLRQLCDIRRDPSRLVAHECGLFVLTRLLRLALHRWSVRAIDLEPCSDKRRIVEKATAGLNFFFF